MLELFFNNKNTGGTMWEAIRNFFMGLIEQAAKEAQTTVYELVKDPDELYKKLNLGELVIKVLDQIDSKPGNNSLDLIPLVPASIEEWIVKKAVYKAFIYVCYQIKKELEK